MANWYIWPLLVIISEIFMINSFVAVKRFNLLRYKSSVSRVQPRMLGSATNSGYLAVHVVGKVTDKNDFYKKTLENAKNSILEAGISRFDFLRDVEKDDEFMLIEVYNTPSGPDDHKKTKHYNDWREGVASLMAVPRSASKYTTIFPPNEPHCWKTEPSASKINIDEYITNLPWDYGISNPSSTFNNERGLLVVVVNVNVKPGSEEIFIQATLQNCKQSIKEGGVHRFDLLRNIDNPTNFVIVEAYNSPAATVAHKATEHYKVWANDVAEIMATPRSSKKYASLFPTPIYWHQSSQLTHLGEGAGISSPTGLKGLSAVPGQSFSFGGPKILFGSNIAKKAIQSALKDLRISRPYVVTGNNGLVRHAEIITEAFQQVHFDPTSSSYSVKGEPTVEDALAASIAARNAGCDGVIAIGGGSSIDLAKAVAALITNTNDIYDYLEVVGKALPIDNPPVPFIAVPTTSGTGSEATKNAVLKSLKYNRKVSIRHDTMIANVAIIDPLLTVTCPSDITAHVGLDALCQVIEPYVSNAANPIVDALAKEGIVRAVRSLRKVVVDGGNLEAREDLAIASLLSGICLANSKLGAVHGFASVLGGMYESAPHGAICASLLPYVFQTNSEKLSKINSSTPHPPVGTLSSESVISPKLTHQQIDAAIKLERFNEVSKLITGNPNANYMDGVAWLQALVRDLKVPNLSSLCVGMKTDDIEEIIKATAVASSTKGNPVVLSIDELREILIAAF